MAVSEKDAGMPSSEDAVYPEIADSSSIPKQNAFQRLLHRTNDLDDLGRDILQQSLQFDEAQLEADAKKVRRKLDFIVLPMVYDDNHMLSFLDKQTLNYSLPYGLRADTHMTLGDYSWVASALYFGWIVAAWPWNIALQRFPIAKLIGGMLFVWGMLCMLQAAVFNFSGFFAIRFFLGMMEACISPAWVLLTSMLWTRDEQSMRTSIWLSTNGISSILGSLLSYGSGQAVGLKIPNWKLIYLIVGALTFLWGLVIITYLPDGPHNARMLTPHERMVAVWRVSKNQIGLKHGTLKPYQIREALLDGKCYLLYASGIAVGILNGGVANFLSAIIQGFGYDALRTSLMQAPGGAFEIVACVFFGWVSQRSKMVGPAIILGCIPGMAGLIGILKIPIENRLALTACCWLQNCLGPCVVLNWTVPGLNVSGHTKRTAVMGTYFVMYIAGNIAGPHLFLDAEVPRYPTAIKGLCGSYGALMVLQGLYMLWCWIENRRRDRANEHVHGDQKLIEGYEDMTDKENKHFRYRL
ncbi:MFS transporter [Pseudomassariella vexata]|uniref:MFS transporter n=1 Tax=Pseudomassariella vexata TaxID=1141098 RepID=A0A1Y2D718_9PEZI|nr:MFS transporter [Pseudomassariella vexata]ORY54954.1 MFS transporter [Pseudomassariella vexata]